MNVMRNKEHQVKMAEVEIEAAKNKSDQLHDQIEKLKNSLKKYKKMQMLEKERECDYECRVKCILQELDAIKQMLQDEQDNLFIQEKIIVDQADTIQKLKNIIYIQGGELKHNN